MPNKCFKPVVLLIYANTGPALDCLKPETEAIAAHLERSGLCDIRVVPAATLSDVSTAINDPMLRDRVTIIHFAGHANGKGIQLLSTNETEHGVIAYMRGLADVFRLQPHLRLVFVNGCASREHVLELTQAGIPLVIATNRGIDDLVARDFAEKFYHALGQQRSIAEAFQVANGMLLSSRGENIRGLYFGEYQTSAAAANSELPWELHGPVADRHWTLGDPYYRGTGPRWDETKYEFDQESPYVGVFYFTENECDRFFGRTELVNALLAPNPKSSILLVTGASGSGKSSVVRAGMIPEWKKRNRLAGPPRVLDFTPEDDPFDQLSKALARVDSFDLQKIRSIRELKSTTTIQDALTTFANGGPLLLFVDQFEQIFTRTTDETSRRRFIESITTLAMAENLHICLILAMRDDFFPQLRDYPALYQITDKNIFRVTALDNESLHEVIERPAAEHGVAFEPNLVNDIVNEVAGQPGALPLLQYTLDRLWKAEDLSGRVLHKSTYDGLGGVMGAVGKRCRDLYERQDKLKDEFRWMMLKLVKYDESVAGPRVMSRLAPKSEFNGKQAELLALLSDEGLVVTSGTSTPSVQLGHEKIIEAWQEYAEWTRDYREANSVRQRLSKAANEWVSAEGEPAKAVQVLWQGAQLQKALELRNQGEFDQLGGLSREDICFLNASDRYSQRMIRLLRMSLGIVLVFAAFVVVLLIKWHENNCVLQQKNEDLVEEIEKHTVTQAKLNRALTSFIGIAEEKAERQENGEALHWFNNLVVAPSIKRFSLRRIGELAPRMGILLRCRDDISVCVFSPDGRWIATGDGRDKSEAERGAVMIWDTKNGNLHAGPLEVPGQVSSLCFSPDSTLLAAGTKTSSRYDPFTGDPRHRSGEVYLFDVATGSQLRNPLPLEGTVNEIAFSQRGRPVLIAVAGRRGDGTRNAEVSDTGMVRAWDTSHWRDPIGFEGHTKPVTCVTISSDGMLAVTGALDKSARLWDVTSGKLVAHFPHISEVEDVVISDDNRVIWTKSRSEDEYALIRWDGAGNQLDNEPKRFSDIHFAAGRVIALSLDCRTMTIWDLTTTAENSQPTEIRPQFQTDKFLHSMLSSNGKYAAMSVRSDPFRVRISDMSNGNKLESEVKLPNLPLFDNRVINSQATKVISWEGTDARLFHNLAWSYPVNAFPQEMAWSRPESDMVYGHEKRFIITAMQISKNCQWLLVGWLGPKFERFWKLWDISNLQRPPVAVWQDDPDQLVLQDGQFLFVTSRKDSAAPVRVWDFEAGEWLGNPMKKESKLRDALVSVNATRVLFVHERDAQLYDSRLGIAVGGKLPGGENSFKFSPDGKVFAASQDAELCLYNSTDGSKLSQPIVASAAISSYCFSADSQVVFLSTKSGIVEAWKIYAKRERKVIHKKIGRDLHIEGLLSGGKLLVLSSGRGAESNIASFLDVATLETWQGLDNVKATKVSPDKKNMFAIVERGEKNGEYEGVFVNLVHLKIVNRVKLDRDTSVNPVYYHVYCQFSPDSRSVLSYDSDGVIRRWVASTGEPLPIGLAMADDLDKEASKIYTAKDGIETVAYGEESKLFLAFGRRGIYCWDAETGLSRPVPDYVTLSSDVAFDESGRTLVIVDDGRLRVQRLPSAADGESNSQHLRLSIAVRTGVLLDEIGTSRPIAFDDWLQHRQHLSSIGGFCDDGIGKGAAK